MRYIIFTVLLIIPMQLFSQFYNKEFGIRGGYSSGFTFRVNIEEDLSYEAQLYYRDQGAIFNVIRQQHREIGYDKFGTWKFLYGFGAHVGFYFTDHYKIFFRQIYIGREIFTPVIGMDGYLAVEYQLIDAPVSFGIDFKPFMEISLKQLFGFNAWDFGINVRYRF